MNLNFKSKFNIGDNVYCIKKINTSQYIIYKRKGVIVDYETTALIHSDNYKHLNKLTTKYRVGKRWYDEDMIHLTGVTALKHIDKLLYNDMKLGFCDYNPENDEFSIYNNCVSSLYKFTSTFNTKWLKIYLEDKYGVQEEYRIFESELFNDLYYSINTNRNNLVRNSLRGTRQFKKLAYELLLIIYGDNESVFNKHEEASFDLYRNIDLSKVKFLSNQIVFVNEAMKSERKLKSFMKNNNY